MVRLLLPIVCAFIRCSFERRRQATSLPPPCHCVLKYRFAGVFIDSLNAIPFCNVKAWVFLPIAHPCKNLPLCKHQTCPITRLSRAASTTALVTSSNVLISRIRWICVNRRLSSRKFPPVTRMMTATVSEASVVRGQLHPHRHPVLLKQLADLWCSQRSELMDEADAGIELRIARETFLSPGMPINIRPISCASKIARTCLNSQSASGLPHRSR